jgi:AraC-like DNA-binding protein
MSGRTIPVEFETGAGQTQIALNLVPPGAQLPAAPIVKIDSNPAPRRRAETVRAESRALSNSHLIEKLTTATVFREFRRAFEAATDLPLTLRGVEGWQLAHRHSRHQHGFCALLYQTNRSRSACLQLQQRVCGGVNGKPCTMSYPFGIIETAVGVKIGPEIVAYLQTGQVFFKPPTPQQTSRALQQVQEWELPVDAREATRLYHETPVVTRSKYEAWVRLLQFFADQLGATANQIVLQHQTAEPAHITRARQFIEGHYQEDVSLSATAQQVGLSTFYLCKQFRIATGVSFTQYVSRLRVEQAKQLLPNLNHRISEIAFTVGCQSLSNFNRIFKSITGASPTEYRRHMPAA